MLVNGQIQEVLPLTDRALHYGDGLFETIRVKDGVAVLLEHHMRRLENSCLFLKIPLDINLLESEINVLLEFKKGLGILKIIISRGAGGRGYSVPQNPFPSRILQYHEMLGSYNAGAGSGINVMRCQHPISTNRLLAGMKHLNRLDQVMASMELSPGIDEGLMFDENGCLVEGIKSNVFLVSSSGSILTPDLSSSGVAGVMRSVLIDFFASRRMPVQIRSISWDELLAAREVFICNSVFGVWPVKRLTSDSVEVNFDTGIVVRMAIAHVQEIF